VHGETSIQCVAEGFLNEARRGEIREPLTQVHRLIIGSQLSEFHPTQKEYHGVLNITIYLLYFIYFNMWDAEW